MQFATLSRNRNFLAIEDAISSFDRSRVAILPVPFEATVSYGHGTRNGPKAILDASAYVEFYDDELDRELCREVGIATVRPPAIAKQTGRSALRRIERAVVGLLEHGKFVMALGGEHSITVAPVVAHHARWPELSVLQIDAHADLRMEYEGSRYSHACAMARVCEVIPPSRLVQVAVRALCSEEAAFARTNGVNTFTAHDIRSGAHGHDWQQKVIDRLSDHVYITFDVDGFDPSIMPSTGTPEPNGLLWAETMRLLRMAGEQRTIVGADVVELAPVRGLHHADLTAARLVYKILNYAFP